MSIEEINMIRIYLNAFDNKQPLDDTPQRKIAEALLELAGIKSVHDLPNGRRVFTVERMPDNVPMADIFWQEDDSDVEYKAYKLLEKKD